MPLPVDALACALAALVIWGGLGWLLARRLSLPPGLVAALAPVIGWAAQNAIGLPAAMLFGLSAPGVIATAGAVAAVAYALPKPAAEHPTARMPAWILAAAALLALAPAIAVLPKSAADGVTLSAAIFDHSKIALIDEMLRTGVPPANPFFDEAGGAGRIAYYYLWHFGAAQTAVLAGTTGWAADVASTWYTAFATLTLTSGLAFHFSHRVLAAACALLVSFGGSLRPMLDALFGEAGLRRLLEPASGLAGWLFQITWSPHHVMSAGCAIAAVLLLRRLAGPVSALKVVILGLLLAAGFESSIWVGGFVLLLAGGLIGLRLMLTLAPEQRSGLLIACLLAAGLALGIAAPLIVEQFRLAGTQSGGLPIRLEAFRVLGPAVPEPFRRLLDVPAYWLVLLAVEVPAAFFPVVIALAGQARWRRGPAGQGDVEALAILALASLVCGGFLVSTVGANNDLGWRAVLPGVMLLAVAASAALSGWAARRAVAPLALAVLGIVLALPQSMDIVAGSLEGEPSPQAQAFAGTPTLWAAVRRHTAVTERVASNPAFLREMTPWPVNISWALLANRRSCFAGPELAIAFAPMPAARRAEIDALFARAFGGAAADGDIAALVERYGCAVVVLTPADGAWAVDPFARSNLYRLVETQDDRWRIYRAVR